MDREAILNFNDIKVQEISIPEWNNAKLFLRVLSGYERDRLEAEIQNGGKMNLVNFRAKMAFLSLCDKDGKRIFTDEKDIAELSKKSSVALSRIFDVATTLNKMSNDDVEGLVKN